jgi:chromosome segregation ATPase
VRVVPVAGWATVVSKDGVVYQGGTFHYARPAVVRAQRRRELRQLQQVQVEIATRIDSIEARLAELQARQQALYTERQGLHRYQTEVEKELAQVRQSHDRLVRERAELERETRWWETVRAEALQQQEEVAAELADRERELPLAVEAKERITRQVAALTEAYTALREQQRQQSNTAAALQAELAMQRQRRENVQRTLASARWSGPAPARRSRQRRWRHWPSRSP